MDIDQIKALAGVKESQPKEQETSVHQGLWDILRVTHAPQPLNEGRDAPLFHGTSTEAAIKILHDNVLLGYENDDAIGDKASVRMSREKHAAKRFTGSAGGVIFVLDQTKLAQRFKIQPFTDHSIADVGRAKQTSESEEAVMVPRIDNLSQYIIGIYVTEERVQRILDMDPKTIYQTLAYMFNGWDYKEVHAGAQALLDHPKRIKE